MKVNTCLKKIPQIDKISELAKETKIKVWLVGGFLRDSCLDTSKDLIDFDFCVEKNIDLFVKKISESLRKKVIVLDKKNSSFRIVVNKNKKNYSYDFILMRGRGIKQDLSQRDFTINTLALDITEPKKILDYYGGIKDLKKKKIKALSDSVISDDPLRILRGFSFASKYGFNIEARTLKFFHSYREKLKKVSYERINQELFKIFDSKKSYKIIKKMNELRVIDQIMPYVEKMRKTGQGGFHHLNVWDHSIETLKQFELLSERKIKNKQEVRDFLNQQLGGGRKRGQIIKLACLIHDAGKPFVKKKTKTRTIFHMHEKIGREISSKFAKRMRLSKIERQKIAKMVFWHLRPGYLADQVTPSRRAVYRFFRDTQEEGVSVILLSLADWRATRGPLTNSLKRKRHEKVMLKLVESYFAEKKKKPVPRIIDGWDLINRLGVKEGPEVGKILAKIKELQALGKVNKKSEALEAAKDILKKI
ncbi:MAG: HD domain-containing protein [Candidatus Omnitrophica bacterium]|nr:HD domain-containing protein [Candidatus Omnitrophota bacterium]MCF7876853.1 HD domain-containing protein [Candidatus Omnitrophota bacterium]MCF7877888.1 HD domain-containing protein [Candidatus Omnitrophota bacterium]MCF7892580.1 HD domain-containing protein [Candidatus Omnitrophota bacterium]